MPNDRFAIRAEGLGKRYYLGQTVDLARNFRETLQTLPRWLGGKAMHKMRGTFKPAAVAADGEKAGAGGDAEPGGRPAIWAVRDLNFTIEPGETVGIIGRNGSGKSTLLKILSRITWPTTGKAEIRGRIGSLLEVGTGFHPELTGRENVYLNGAILGMKNAEIQRKFDEIVAFSGVEKFLDTPVKRYSSGMRVRLAFAVAAHLETDVLVIDEVLAVGDAEFQQKCLGKMQDVAGGGRTVLFVSHNMQAVRNLCRKSILLEKGRMMAMGQTEEVSDEYQRMILGELRDSSGRFERPQSDRPKRETWVGGVELRDASGKAKTRFAYGEDLTIAFELSGKSARPGTTLTWILYDSSGSPLGYANSKMLKAFSLEDGEMRAQCTIKSLPLASGRYTFAFSSGILNSGDAKDIWSDAATFEIAHCDPFQTKFEQVSRPYGAVVFEQEWRKESRKAD